MSVDVTSSTKSKGNFILTLDNWEDWEDISGQSEASVISLTDVGYQEQLNDYRKPRHINDADILAVFPIMTLLKFYQECYFSLLGSVCTSPTDSVNNLLQEASVKDLYDRYIGDELEVGR